MATAVVVGLFTAARFGVHPGKSTIFPQEAPRLGGSIAETVLIQIRIWAFDLRQIVCPMDLCADYGPYSLRHFEFAVCLLALVGTLCLQGILSMGCRVFGFGAITFWFFLLPASNLLPMFRPMADRYLYFPMIGVAMMLASVLAKLSHRPAAILLVMAAAITPLAARTLSQERIWHDSASLWASTLATNPASIEALDNLAWARLEEGKPGAALEGLENGGLALRFAGAETFAVKAIALEALGRQAQADAAYKQARQLDPRYAQPALLVQGLTWNRQNADKLQTIVNRN